MTIKLDLGIVSKGDEQMTNRSEEWLKSLCKGLGNVIHKIGEDLDIACE